MSCFLTDLEPGFSSRFVTVRTLSRMSFGRGNVYWFAPARGEEHRRVVAGYLPLPPLFPVVESVVEVQRVGARAESELFGCRSLEFLEQVAEGLPRGEAHLPGYVGHASGILFQ